MSILDKSMTHSRIYNNICYGSIPSIPHQYKVRDKKMQKFMNRNEVFLILCCGVLFAATMISALANIEFKLDARCAIDDSKGFWFKRRYFVLGIVLSVFAGIADMFVVGYIPFSIRCCFSALTIPVSVLLARLILGETLTELQVLGMMLATFGSVGGILSANHTTSSNSSIDSTHNAISNLSPLATTIFILASIVVVVGVIELMSSVPHKTRRLISLTLSAYTTSFFAALSTLFAKLTSEAIIVGGFANPSVWFYGTVCISVSIVQLSFMAQMMKKFTAIECIPAYQILNTAWLAIVSTLLFGESLVNPSLFVLSLLLSMIGISTIANARNLPSPSLVEETRLKYVL